MTLNHVKRYYTLVLTSVLIVILSIASVSDSYAQSLSSIMSNGDYQPGAVLLYRNGGFRVATRSDVDRSANSYVLIHGAHTDSTNDSFVKVSKKILETDPDADIYYVDWAYWSKFNSDKMEQALEEQAQWLITTLAVTAGIDIIDKLFGDGTLVGEDEYAAVIMANLAALAARIVANILPVEQTIYIPSVADRAYCILFTTDDWTFTTGDQEGSFEGLGLNPAKTHIIGHSHGAHVGGLICKRVENNLGKKVKRLSCLDPSTSSVHTSGENSNGSGWNRNVAGLVDVYRTSVYCCDSHIYGDFNLQISCPSQHPALNGSEKNVESPDEVLDYLISLCQAEMKFHSLAIELFGGMCESDDFLKAKSFSELDDVMFDGEDSGKDGQWITLTVN